MDFKKLFENNKAVSPVIGVILMVAITVILAAAIGSSVFGHGTAESAPQANFDIKSAKIAGDGANAIASVKLEHLGGEPVHFNDTTATKVTASIKSGDSVAINATSLAIMDVGDVKTLELKNTANNDAFGDITPVSGDTVNIKIIDVETNQLICDKDVRL